MHLYNREDNKNRCIFSFPYVLEFVWTVVYIPFDALLTLKSSEKKNHMISLLRYR